MEAAEKWIYEEFIKPREVNVSMFRVNKKTEAVRLSKVQRYVCRLFKITPEVKYNYEVAVEIDAPKIIRKNNIVLTSDKNKWLVVEEFGVRLLLVNIEPIVLNSIIGKMYRMSSVYSER